MTDPLIHHDDLHAVLSALVDGRLTAAEFDALHERLLADDQVMDQYLRFVDLNTELAFRCAPGTPGSALDEELTPTLSVRRSRMRSVWYFAAAALIALAVTAWFFLDSTPHSALRNPHSSSLALLTDAEDAVFADGASDMSSPSGSLGVELGSGPLHLASGKIQVMFKSGAVVDVIGPADFDIIGPNRGHLSRGTVVAYVPAAAHGFTITAPRGAEVIDLGTRFALRVGESGDSRVDVLTGRVIMSVNGLGRTIAAGQAWTADIAGEMRQVDWDAAPWVIADVVATDPIPLGNLFDDTADQPLESAIDTDDYMAAADVADLGVDRVIQGGEAIQELAPGVKVDLATLGWSGHRYGSITNDAWNTSDDASAGGVSTTGERINSAGPAEQGLGMHANAVIVFDLAELRRAGRLDEQLMRFISDRAGINDDAVGVSNVHARLAAVAIGPAGVIDAQVNGRTRLPHRDTDGVWKFDTPTADDVVTSDGRFVRFDLPIGPEVSYLALIATGAGDVDGGIGNDHTVFSGARLEIAP